MVADPRFRTATGGRPYRRVNSCHQLGRQPHRGTAVSGCADRVGSGNVDVVRAPHSVALEVPYRFGSFGYTSNRGGIRSAARTGPIDSQELRLSIPLYPR